MKPLMKLAFFSILAVASVFAQKEAKKLTRSEALSAAVTKVQPEYPPVARQLKISGEVELEVTITEEGIPENVRIVSGNPVLTRPCVEALKRWRFKPFTDEGKAVKAVADLSFTFQKP
jgi:periplasmic protein TonB